MIRRRILLILAPVLVSAAVLLTSRPARAGITLHAEQDFGILTNARWELGFGFSGRIGYRFDLGPLWLAPELGGGYVGFGDVGGYALHPARAFGGGRLGIGGFIQPQVYGHLGYGWMGGIEDVSLEGAMFEVGGALDLRIIPILGIGIHVGYTSNQIDASAAGRGALNWVNFGVHLGLTF